MPLPVRRGTSNVVAVIKFEFSPLVSDKLIRFGASPPVPIGPIEILNIQARLRPASCLVHIFFFAETFSFGEFSDI